MTRRPAPDTRPDRNTRPTGHTDARCTGYDSRSGTPCYRDAVDTVIAACVHEHIGPRRLCQFHIADLAHDLMVCGDCKDGRDPHRCVLVAVPTRKKTHA